MNLPGKYRPGRVADIIFCILLLAGLLPVLGRDHFTTLDGAAHCYNARIWQSLLSDPQGFYGHYFRINPFPVPNYSGHVLLVLLHTVFSWNVCEKIIAGLFLLLMPILFRQIVLHLNPSGKWWCLMVFPFSHYILLYYGFYNFSIGVIVLLWGIYLRLKYPYISAWQVIAVCLLGAVLYFSHLFTFLVYLFFVAAHELTLWSGHKNTRLFLRRSGALLLALLPWLLLSAWYFKHNPSGAGEDLWPLSKTIGFYMAADYLKVYSPDTNLACTVLAYLVLVASLACTLLYARGTGLRHLPARRDNLLFLLLCLVMALLAFTMPNTSGNAGYIIYRFVYLGLIFQLVWTGSVPIKPLLAMGVAGLGIVCSLGIQWHNIHGQKAIDNEYKDFIKAERYINNNSVVAPFFFNRYGFTEHFSNYLSSSKDLIILENYEAATQYFPVAWRKENLPQAYFTDSLSVASQGLFTTGQQPGALIPDYIVINGRDPGNTAYSSLLRYIGRSFSLIYSNNTVSLYKKHSP